MSDRHREVARAAKNGLWRIVRHAARPDTDREKAAVIAELVSLLSGKKPTPVLREVLWMLSEIGRDESVPPIAAHLPNTELREDARMALERIPGERALAALKAGMKAVSDDFKPNLAHSLRKRGVAVHGVPDLRLKPIKETRVRPVKPR
jgi:hypothetical protein